MLLKKKKKTFISLVFFCQVSHCYSLDSNLNPLTFQYLVRKACGFSGFGNIPQWCNYTNEDHCQGVFVKCSLYEAASSHDRWTPCCRRDCGQRWKPVMLSRHLLRKPLMWEMQQVTSLLCPQSPHLGNEWVELHDF